MNLSITTGICAIKKRFKCILGRYFTIALILLLSASARQGFSQASLLDKKVTLQLTDVTISDVLSALQDQTGASFSYSNTNLKTSRRVTADYKNISLQEALVQLLGETLSKVRVKGNVINLQGSGNVKGSVKTSDGNPVEAVNIRLKFFGKGTITDEDGAFMLRNIPAGPQTVVIQLLGYESIERDIEILTDRTVTLPAISLNEDSKTLQEVMVLGNNNKFANKESEYAARMPLKNLENAQVYSVISKELLNQQIVVDYQDALKAAPGVVPFISAAGTNLAYIRGFSVEATIRNGMAAQAWTLVDPANVERIEVLKGPAGTLFGSNFTSFGAVVNRVIKKPLDTFRGEVSFSLGSWDLSRINVDVNTPVNEDKTALLRVNAALHNEKTFQNFGGNKSYIFAPSFSYKVNEKLSFLFDIEMFKGQMIQQPYNVFTTGLSFRNVSFLDKYRKNSFAGADIEGTKISNNYYGQMVYKFSEKWTSSTNLAYSFNREADQFQLRAVWLMDTVVARTFWKNLRRDFSTINFQQNFNGEFNIGPVRNRVLLGLNLIRNTDNRFVIEDPKYDTINPAKPFRPFYKNKADAIVAKSTIRNSHTDWTTYGAYFSNVSNLTDRLILMLSLRLDHYRKSNSLNGGLSNKDKYNQTALSPKIGLVYQIVKEEVSIFANYLNGFNNLGPATQPDGSVFQLKPQRANQWEAGIKTETFNKKLSVTLSFYDIQVSNSTRNDANQFLIQDGTQKSQGWDLEVITNPVKGLNFLAGYAYNKNTYIKAAESVTGKTVTGAPKNVFNTWISYKHSGRILNNVGIGLGGNYVSEVFYDAANLFVIPAYTVANGTVFFEHTKWRIGLKVNNIGDKMYYSSWGYPQATRQFIGNLTFRF